MVFGIGFLGGGVILWEGFNVCGLNMVVMFWCLVVVGVLVVFGYLVFILIGIGIIVVVYFLGCLFGWLVDCDNVVEDEGL